MNIKSWYYNNFHKGRRIDFYNLREQNQKVEAVRLKKKIKDFNEAELEPNNVEELELDHCSEGRNIDENGKEFWVCSHCTRNMKFETWEEYVWHHLRVHI